MGLLGENGLGFELARWMEACGTWRAWLGDSTYATFQQHISSPSSWEAFMRPNPHASNPLLHLQFRVRALLFDRACVPPNNTSSSFSLHQPHLSKLNPNHLQLHGDDVYFTLENSLQDGSPTRDSVGASISLPSKEVPNHGKPRNEKLEMENISQMCRQEDIGDSWYTKFFDNYKASRAYMISSAEKEMNKRTSEDMATYIRHAETHKRKRAVFRVENKPSILSSESPIIKGNSSVEDDKHLFPETMFTFNCVPESALSRSKCKEYDCNKIEALGVFDTWPQIPSRNHVIIERLGIKPNYLSSENRTSNGGMCHIGKEQASHMCTKVIAKILIDMGFEGATEIPLDTLTRFFDCHILKLGKILKILADSYRKCSAIQLIKMFLHTSGYSVSDLEEQIDGAKMAAQQPLQGSPSQHQSTFQKTHQISRVSNLQAENTMDLQKQQQSERIGRVQQTPFSVSSPANVDTEVTTAEVKVEMFSETPTDNTNVNNRQNHQTPTRHHQLAVMSNLQNHHGTQARQMASLHTPQSQIINGSGGVRAPLVKVEGFQELMGGVKREVVVMEGSPSSK